MNVSTYPHVYKGFLFGHYDSRGGATFICSHDELSARARYVEMGNGLENELECAAKWANDPNAAHEWAELHAIRDDRPAAIRWLTKEDFISAVTLESYREIADGEDIEWLGNEADPIERARASAFDEGLQWASPEVESTTANPYCELLWWHEDTATLRLCDKAVNPGQPNEVPGWKRSEFGEDACGVIFCATDGTE